MIESCKCKIKAIITTDKVRIKYEETRPKRVMNKVIVPVGVIDEKEYRRLLKNKKERESYRKKREVIGERYYGTR
jgi:hypothetical protein